MKYLSQLLSIALFIVGISVLGYALKEKYWAKFRMKAQIASSIKIDQADFKKQLMNKDPSGLEKLDALLKSKNPVDRKVGVDFLEGQAFEENELFNKAEDADPAVRYNAWIHLEFYFKKTPGLCTKIKGLKRFPDDSQGITLRAKIFEIKCESSPEEKKIKIQQLLSRYAQSADLQSSVVTNLQFFDETDPSFESLAVKWLEVRDTDTADNHIEVRRRAARILSELKSPQLPRFLDELVEDDDKVLGIMAVQTLARECPPNTIHALIRAAFNGKFPEIRSKAQDALIRLRLVSTWEQIHEVLEKNKNDDSAAFLAKIESLGKNYFDHNDCH